MKSRQPLLIVNLTIVKKDKERTAHDIKILKDVQCETVKGICFLCCQKSRENKRQEGGKCVKTQSYIAPTVLIRCNFI